MQRRMFLVSLGAFALVGCRKSEPKPTPTATPSATASASTATPAPQPTSTATSTPSPAPTATPRPSALEPVGFPIAPGTRTGRVVGEVGSRTIHWGEGAEALAYSRDDQPSDDPVRANACGWNARTHLEYEGQPAVDWYVEVGTPVLATMDGTATLLINTVSNPFDFYGVSREPYIGNPDRSRAPISPFPGPGGGQGAFVRIENEQYRTDSAHLEVTRTLKAVPADAYLAGYSAAFDFAGAFAEIRDFRVATAVATWQVKAGDVIGYTGDSGYSEAPHLHYAIRPAGGGNALCPTNEAGFEDGGWLFRT
ncbi:MAG: M23 family metallopeptidase [Dehalococcoidia bacterium]